MVNKTNILILVLTVATILISYGLPCDKNKEKTQEPVIVMETVVVKEPDGCPMEQSIKNKPFTAEEVEVITRTLAGECYDDKLKDKRLVVEVILNRVSDGRFGKSVIDVVTAKSQFVGYWNQGRPISESDIQIAEEALCEWYGNDCEKISDYLFFCAGPNRENVFRVSYN